MRLNGEREKGAQMGNLLIMGDHQGHPNPKGKGNLYPLDPPSNLSLQSACPSQLSKPTVISLVVGNAEGITSVPAMGEVRPIFNVVVLVILRENVCN